MQKTIPYVGGKPARWQPKVPPPKVAGLKCRIPHVRTRLPRDRKEGEKGGNPPLFKMLINLGLFQETYFTQ
jgi:hypothetical protein